MDTSCLKSGGLWETKRTSSPSKLEWRLSRYIVSSHYISVAGDLLECSLCSSATRRCIEITISRKRRSCIHEDIIHGRPTVKSIRIEKTINCRGNSGPMDRTKTRLEVPWARVRRNMSQSGSRQHQRRVTYCRTCNTETYT